MRILRIARAAALGLIVISFAACGGGGAESKTDIKTTTLGQELSDLKKALDDGAINQKDYDRQKKKILSRK